MIFSFLQTVVLQLTVASFVISNVVWNRMLACIQRMGGQVAWWKTNPELTGQPSLQLQRVHMGVMYWRKGNVEFWRGKTLDFKC